MNVKFSAYVSGDLLSVGLREQRCVCLFIDNLKPADSGIKTNIKTILHSEFTVKLKKMQIF